MKLMCCRNCLLYSVLWIIREPSICLSHNLGGWMVVLIALVSKSSIKRLFTMGLMEDPLSVPCTCSYYLTWKRELIFLRQNFNSIV